MLRKSSKRAGRVVKYTLADGTVTTKRYAPYKPKAKPTGKTVGDMLAAWEMSPGWTKLADNTKRQYAVYSRYLLSLQSAQVKSVDRASLLDLRDAVIKKSGNGAGIAFASVTSAAFGWAVGRGWIEHSPATKLHVEIERGHLPAWEEKHVPMALAALSEHLRRAVVLALYTGQRRGDLIAMQWSAYNGTKITVIPEKTKRRTAVIPLVIPAPPELRAELDSWKPDPATGPILTTKFGKPWRMGSNLSKQIGDALSKIKDFPAHHNIHGLRKLAATRLAQAGCTLHEIAAITGHQSLGMLQLYTRSVDQERAAESAAEKMEKRREITKPTNSDKPPKIG